MISNQQAGSKLITPLIETCLLRCERDERVLFEALSFKVFPEEVVLIGGPNGCGKTTLLRLLTTVSHDYQGDILWNGKPLKQNRFDYLNHITYIGHLPSVKKTLSPRENLDWLCSLRGHVNREGIDHALERVGLFGYEDVPCYALSAGQLRRVALARLYLTSTPLWILDEPFTAIDKQGVENLEALLKAHAARGGAVILTTHQPISLDKVKVIQLEKFRPTITHSEFFGAYSNSDGDQVDSEREALQRELAE